MKSFKVYLTEDLDIKQKISSKLKELKTKALELYPELSKMNQFKNIKVKISDQIGRDAGHTFFISQTIFLNKKFLEDHEDEMLNQILGHEFCHVISTLITGDQFHGKKWKEMMKSMGLRPETYHELGE